ncbi:MAG: class I SAM-dependent methyltransferase [Deltaproteobacteria bacterium]|nr:class I SAM-dependent methyltransferase [Deltaproteobacteria bacterium]
MKTFREILADIDWAMPDSQYCSNTLICLPRYKRFHELIMHNKRESSTTYVDRNFCRRDKIKRKLTRVKAMLKKMSLHFKITPDTCVLDLGSGLGMESLILHFLTGVTVCAVDRETQIEFKKRSCHINDWYDDLVFVLKEAGICDCCLDKDSLNSRVRSIAADASQLPVMDNSFDLVFSIYSLEHFTKLEQTVGEIRRVLRPGGVFYFKTSNYNSLVGPHTPGIIDIPWAHLVISKKEICKIKKEIDPTITDDDLEMFMEINENTLDQWKAVFPKDLWHFVKWDMIRDPDLSEKDIPDWVLKHKPDEVSIDDILVEDIEAILINNK